MADRTIAVRLTANVQDFKREMRSAAYSMGDLEKRAGGAEKVAQTALGKMAQSAKLQRESWDAAGRTLMGFGAVTLASLGGATAAAIKWESAWTGVTKTVDGSATQMAALEGELRKLATTLPATHQEIAAVAEAAGQLGIKRADVASFTKTMIDLSETTNLTADEAATSIAQLMNIMGTAPADVDKLGSSLVALGNDGASTERDIVQMAQRIASAGKIIGLSEGEVMGLANGLASVGIEVEAGGSAISKVMIDISKSVSSGGDDLNAWAKVAGMSAQEFATAWKNDPATALATTIEGLGRMNAAGEDVFATLSDLGQSDVRVTRALLSMANSGDLLRSSLQLGNEAWAENTALIAEAEKRYDTAEAKIQIAKNSIYDAGISMGETFLPAIATAAEAVAGLAQGFSSLPSGVQGAIGTLSLAAGTAMLGAGAFLKLFPAVMETRTHFANLAATAPGLTAKLGGLTRAAGLVGVALAGIEFVNFISQTRGADSSISEITSSLLGLDGTLESLDAHFTAESGSPWMKSRTESAQGAMWQILEYGETFAGKMDQLMPGDSLADMARENFEKVGESLAVLASSGDAERAAEMFQLLEDEWIAMGGDTAGLLELMPAYSDALLDIENDATLTAAASEDFAKQQQAAADAARQVADALKAEVDAMEALRDSQMNAERANITFEKSLDDITDAAKKNGTSLDANTEKGRANRSAILDSVDATNKYADALITNGASADEVSASLAANRERLLDSAEAAGFSREEMAAYIDTMMMTPEEIVTKIEANTAEAEAKHQELLQKIGSSSAAITITAEDAASARARSIASNISNMSATIRVYGQAFQADGGIQRGIVPSFADGKLPGQAMIQSPRAGLVQWAEPETGGEAFIPLAASKRARSLKIWAETGKRLGALSSFAAGGFTSSSLKTISASMQSQLPADVIKALTAALVKATSAAASTDAKALPLEKAAANAAKTVDSLEAQLKALRKAEKSRSEKADENLDKLKKSEDKKVKAAEAELKAAKSLPSKTAAEKKKRDAAIKAADKKLDSAKAARDKKLDAAREKEAEKAKAARKKIDKAQDKLDEAKEKEATASEKAKAARDKATEAEKKRAETEKELAQIHEQLANAARQFSEQLQATFRQGFDAADLLSNMQDGAASIAAFQAQIDALRKAGLDESLVQTVIDQGTEAGAETAASILAGGASGIADLNRAAKELAAAADALGKTQIVGLPQYSTGGVVGGNGRPRADDQLILASTGEGVVTNRGMDVLGVDGLMDLNSGNVAALSARHYVAAPRGQAQAPAFPDHLTLTAGSLTGQMRLVGDGIFELVDARLEAYAGMGAARTRGA